MNLAGFTDDGLAFDVHVGVREGDVDRAQQQGRGAGTPAALLRDTRAGRSQAGAAAGAKAETVQPTRQVTTSPERAIVRTDPGFQRLTSLENSR